ncbi:hypothetical protein MNR01_07255 [Lysobacter sp. S4-A87]|uniref:hypothetical protein n=1 Tax=Lysobacter sp. S4-A87 TaxID=2925843 RepID=UPI001F53A1B3|nr:hypothetical protein [Lysobacter sp. S4-A87]UNK50791.1 hypothetical protein MNR01_07255 [Lysobacter sp. S4-A87]
MTGPSDQELGEARWFPTDLDVPSRTFSFVALDDAVIDRSSFLDTRIDAPLAAAVQVGQAQIQRDQRGQRDLPSARVAWLFHTSFCGSTLAARALHCPPAAVCLREPLVLRRLADARHRAMPLQGLLETTVGLLARPWHAGGAVVIKPTHAALNLASDMLAATPGSRAVVLTSSLQDFLVSNLKKPPESQSRIPQLAERALAIGTFASRLPPQALAPPDLLCAAALQWAAQREVMADLVAVDDGARVRAIDMSWLLDDLADAMTQCARWLQVEIPEHALRDRCEGIGGRNAKAMDVAYSAAQRASEAEIVVAHFARELANALAWSERWLLPAMRPQARLDPARWSQA